MNAPAARILALLRSRRAPIPIFVLLVVFVALGLRLWQLNSVPPGLWWDEATQGIDAGELLRGQFRIFYPTALGKEPLYIYLTAPFVAAWYGQPFAVRLTGALLSVLMVPALYGTGRALFIEQSAAGAWAGLAAALLWATNFWAQSISRIGFQVNAFPLILTVAVLSWLNYVRRPGRGRALAFGVISGLALYTYLAARFTPILWLALFLLLPRTKQRAMRPTLAHAVLAFVLVVLPLGVYFVLHPADFFSRISTFGVAQGTAAVVKPETLEWATQVTLKAFLGLVGDPIARHNLPDAPSFTPIASVLFGLGLLTGFLAIALRRHQGALTAILWWALLCVPAILSRSSTPHYPRLFGALPAAMLIAALPFGFGVEALHRVRKDAVAPVLSVLIAALLVFETAHTAEAYFVRWARETDLYTFFQQDLWTIGEKVESTPGAVGVVALNEGYGKQLDYAFADTPIFQLPAGEQDVAGWMDAHLGRLGGEQVVSVVWGQGANQDADPKQLIQHYLSREGEALDVQPFRGFQLESFRLGDHPQFAASGQSADVQARFESDVTLRGARWGAAYPNPDRNSNVAAAGTPFWVVLTWHLGSSQPDLRTAVDLFDSSGHRLASTEAPLMDLRARMQSWRPGDTLQTYYLVTVPATQPPGPLVLAARLYNAKTGAPVLLQEPVSTPDDATGRTRLTVPFAEPIASQAVRLPTPPVARQYHRAFEGGVTLLGADDWVEKVRPGEKLALRLYWQVNQPAASPRSFRVTVGGQPSGGGAPARSAIQIPAGLSVPAVIHTDVDVALSPEAEQGQHVITLQDASGDSFELGKVEVAGAERVWQAPPVTQEITATFGSAVAVLGVDAPPDLPATAGQAITVSLVWKALQPPETEVARFVHVLGPDGRPLAQRSGVPCAGQDGIAPEDGCPSTSWLPNEILVDTVSLALPADLPPGRYPLATGWYDPATLQRLPVRDGAGRPVPDDLLRLPVELVVGGGG